MSYTKTSYFSLFFLLCITWSSYAQKENKLYKLEEKGKYEKMISLTEKQIRKGGKDPKIWYYHIKAQLLKTRNTSEREKERAYYAATKTYKRWVRLVENDTLFAVMKSDMQNTGYEIIFTIPENKSARRKYYVSFLAEYFADTLDLYYLYFPPELTPLITEITGKETDSILVSSLQVEKEGIQYTRPNTIPSPLSIIKKSEEVLNTPWVYTGISPEKGFDCSGFVLWTYRQFGYDFPHRTKLLAKIGQQVELSEAQSGDMVCFGALSYLPENVYHVGLIHSMIDEEVYMIHCGTRKGVSIVPLTSGYWSEVDFFIVRIAE